MKKFFLIAMMTLLPVLAFAQNKHRYSDEQIRGAYEGTWKYENEETNEVFIITLVHKKRFDFDFGFSVNRFLGFLYYSKDGVVYYDNLKDTSKISNCATYNDIDINILINHVLLDGFAGREGYLIFSFEDERLNSKHFNDFIVRAERMDSENNYLYWDMNEIWEKSYNIIPRHEPTDLEYPEGCTIPMKVTLKRVR